MPSPLMTLTGLDGSKVTFHVSRMFGVTAPFAAEDGKKFDCVVALRTVETDRVVMFPVMESPQEARGLWELALRGES